MLLSLVVCLRCAYLSNPHYPFNATHSCTFTSSLLHLSLLFSSYCLVFSSIVSVPRTVSPLFLSSLPLFSTDPLLAPSSLLTPSLVLSLQLSSAYLIDLLAAMEKKTDAGIVKALATNNGLSPTYFSYECLDFHTLSGKVYCKQFEMHSLPLFLEGPVRHMKIVNDQARAREILRLAKVRSTFTQSLCF